MALIYRAIFEVVDADGAFVERAPSHGREWLRWKLERPSFELPEGGPSEVEPGTEIAVSAGADDDCSVYRLTLFEGSRDDGVEVKTTFTALSSGDESWAWVDLERWTPDLVTRPWVPTAPGVIGTLLRSEAAKRGPTALRRGPRVITGEDGAALAEAVVDPTRQIPVVVATYSEAEEDGVRAAENRGWELARRLAGVASVVVLGRGAVSAFSRAMIDLVGADSDVYAGAVRSYLPGIGGDGDRLARHRFVPFRTLRGRDPALAARILAPALVRRAAESPPPPLWRLHAKRLIDRPDRSQADLLEFAEAELAEQGTVIDQQRAEILQLQDQLTDERETVDDLLQQNDSLSRTVSYLRGLLPSGDSRAYTAPAEDEFEPILCSEVAREARDRLTLLAIPDEVLEGADGLDEHGDISWARKAWLSFKAMQSYCEAKRDGSFDGDFKLFCERSRGTAVISPRWVARKETKLTMSNPRFRELRVLPVAVDVDESGKILMEEHIKIEQGGTPCPRIHYYDDTRGTTGMIHIGWFGDHLDSRAKS